MSGVRHFYIPHTTPCLSLKSLPFVFHFSWVLQSSQKKLKTMFMQNLGGKRGVLWGCGNGEWKINNNNNNKPLFTLGSVYSTSASGAEQTTETNISN